MLPIVTHWPIQEALGQLPSAADSRFIEIFHTAHASAEIIRPLSSHPLPAHDRDEFYIVVHGHGTLCAEGLKRAIAPGDLAFLPAGTAHHFEEFEESFTLWVIYAGPPRREQTVVIDRDLSSGPGIDRELRRAP